MKGLCHEGSKPTQFKKGSRPHTWLPIGSVRVVPGGSAHTTWILEKKVNDLPGPNHVRWHPVHRLVWEAANGPVPARSVGAREKTYTAPLSLFPRFCAMVP